MGGAAADGTARRKVLARTGAVKKFAALRRTQRVVPGEHDCTAASCADTAFFFFSKDRTAQNEKHTYEDTSY